MEYIDYVADHDRLELYFWAEPQNYYAVKIGKMTVYRSELTGEVVGVGLDNLQGVLRELLGGGIPPTREAKQCGTYHRESRLHCPPPLNDEFS